MPLIEVDDTTHAALAQNGIKFADATDRLKKAADMEAAFRDLTNGKNRLAFLKLYKEQYPNAAVPEIDAAAPILSEVAELRKLFEDKEKEREEKEAAREKTAREASAQDTVSKGRTWLRRDRKLDDDGVTEVEKVMQDLGIPNYEVAFNHWKASQPPEPATDLPSSYAGRSLDWFRAEADQPDHQLLLKDPLAYRSKRMNEILTKVRAGTMDEFGRTINRAA